MKNNRYFYIKISMIATIFLMIILWILLFFLPTNKYIYNSNKTIKELKRKIQKYRRDKARFQSTNFIETKLMIDLQNKFENRFYKIQNKESRLNFYRQFYDHIQYYQTYNNSNIIDMQIITETNNPLSQNRYRATGPVKNKKYNNLLFQIIPKLEEQTIKLSFNGNLKDALNFINRVTWSKQYLEIKELEISSNYKLALNIYYINDIESK